MDVSVELNYPVDFVVSPEVNKNFVMGSDEVLGGDNNNDNHDNITVSTLVGKEVVEVEESIIANPRAAAASIQHSSSLFDQKDETSSITALESISLEKVLHLEHCQDAIQKPVGGISEQLNCNCSNGPSWIPRPEEVQVRRRGGKVTRSSSGCSKKPRLSLLEDSTGPYRVADSKDSSDKLGPHTTKIDSNGKPFSLVLNNQMNTSVFLSTADASSGLIFLSKIIFIVVVVLLTKILLSCTYMFFNYIFMYMEALHIMWPLSVSASYCEYLAGFVEVCTYFLSVLFAKHSTEKVVLELQHTFSPPLV